MGMGAEIEGMPQQRSAMTFSKRLGIGHGVMEGEVKICNYHSTFTSISGLWVPRNSWLMWGLGIKQWMREDSLKGNICVITGKGRQGKRGSCSRRSATELEIRRGDWFWRNRGTGEFQLTYLLCWMEWAGGLLSVPQWWFILKLGWYWLQYSMTTT